jgi:methanogenic corrinoid protein MtbC1
MAQSTAEIGRMLDSMREALAGAVADRHYLVHPELEARDGYRGRMKLREEAAHQLAFLAQAMSVSRPALFTDYLSWAGVMRAARGLGVDELAANLGFTTDVLKYCLSPEDASAACAYVEAGIAHLREVAPAAAQSAAGDEPLDRLARSYLHALLACQRHEAGRLILDAVDHGTPVKSLYLHVFQRALHEIGRLWQINRITVAQEHYCTAATQTIMSRLCPRIPAAPENSRRFVGACVSGELHDIGIRMVADCFEMEGWDVILLGASVPCPDLIRTLQDRRPDVVGISATIASHVGAVAQTVSMIRSTPGCQHMKTLVGGRPFLVVPDLWKEMNADGSGRDAQDAVDLANELLLGREVA